MKVTLPEITGGYNIQVINSNFDTLESILNDQVLYRNNPIGEPNQLMTDMDVNGRSIYNLPEPLLSSQAARLQDVQNAISGAKQANLISFTPTATISATNVQAAIEVVAGGSNLSLPGTMAGIGGGMQFAASIAFLRLIPKNTPANHVMVQGYYAVNDGGHGLYHVDLTDTTTADDGGSVIVANDGGRWKLQSNNLNVKQFGAKGDGATDDTAAFQAAIIRATKWITTDWYNAGNPPAKTMFTVSVPTANYRIMGSIIIPQGLLLDGENSTIIGNGFGTTNNDIFVSGGYNAGGTLVSNIGTPANTYRVVGCKIKNFRFVNARKAFNLYCFAEESSISGMTFYNCRQAIKADYCFYGKFSACTSRGSAGGASEAAFEFLSYVNVENIDGVVTVDRVLGMHIGGEINGQALNNVTVESGVTGLKITAGVQVGSTCGPIRIGAGCYFEALTGSAIDMSDAAHQKVAVTIDDVFFNTCANGIVAASFSGKIGSQNRFLNVTNPVYISPTDYGSFGIIEINGGLAAAVIANNGAPSLPAGYTVGPKCKVVFPMLTYDSGTGAPTTKINHTNGLVELLYAGDSGFVPSGVPYCSSSKSAGTSFSVFLDTRITFNAYVMTIFKVVVTDNDGVWNFMGRSFGSQIFQDGATAGRTVSISNVGGFIRMTFATMAHPSAVFSIEGVVRIA